MFGGDGRQCVAVVEYIRIVVAKQKRNHFWCNILIWHRISLAVSVACEIIGRFYSSWWAHEQMFAFYSLNYIQLATSSVGFQYQWKQNKNKKKKPLNIHNHGAHGIRLAPFYIFVHFSWIVFFCLSLSQSQHTQITITIFYLLFTWLNTISFSLSLCFIIFVESTPAACAHTPAKPASHATRRNAIYIFFPIQTLKMMHLITINHNSLILQSLTVTHKHQNQSHLKSDRNCFWCWNYVLSTQFDDMLQTTRGRTTAELTNNG